MSCRNLALRRLRSRSSAGFTLVELLVVISIIGMLMALLLPAVQQAREAGRRNTCNSNLHNTALAVMNFATSKNAYPGYVEALPLTTNTVAGSGGGGGGGGGSGGSSSATNYVYPVSWVVPILPYMERTDVYTIWRNYSNWSAAGGSTNVPPAIYMDVLNCPSSPPLTKQANTPCAYVANSGMVDTTAAAGIPADWQANGVFFNHFNLLSAASGQTVSSADSKTTVASQVANAGPQTSISQDYITVHDGSSLTLMLSENNNAPLASITKGVVSAAAPQSPGSGYWGPGNSAPMSGGLFGAGTEPQNCFVWWPDAAPADTMKINAQVTVNYSTGAATESNPAYFMHPSSNHPTGVMVAFCDAHTRFISQDVDYTVFCLLMTPYGAYCNTPGYVATPPLDPGTTTNTTYYPGGGNYNILRVRPIDESAIN